MRNKTILTPEWVASKQTFLDWDTQPSLFKHYPDFCHRVRIADHPKLSWLSEVRRITDERRVVQKSYFRLNVPSAGNLHPIEIYLQIRNISGVLSGIYHFDVLHQTLVMIREIGGEGIEPFVGLNNRYNGILIMFSIVPYRSFWKYRLRSWRYLYLDLGHQLGAFGATMHHYALTVTKMSPECKLNLYMGMGNDEVIGAVYGIGEETDRFVQPLKYPLMYVQPTEYSEPMESLSIEIQNNIIYTEILKTVKWDNFPLYNTKRRSAREFNPLNMKPNYLYEIMEMEASDGLETIPIVLQAHSMECGLYRDGICVENHNFISEIVHLLLDQRFITGAAMVILIFGEEFTAHNHIKAGIYAQEVYMKCEELGLGCSGIGAFYDELASVWSDKNLLYAVAIGGKYE